MDATTKEPSLKLLISRQAADVKSWLAIDREWIAIGVERGWAIVGRADAIARQRSCYQAAIVAPIHSEPGTVLPGLVLHVGCLVESLVVVNAERRDIRAATPGRNRARPA